MSLSVGDVQSFKSNSVTSDPASQSADAKPDANGSSPASSSPVAKAADDVVKAARTLFQNSAPTAKMGAVPGDEKAPAEEPIILAGRCTRGGYCR